MRLPTAFLLLLATLLLGIPLAAAGAAKFTEPACANVTCASMTNGACYVNTTLVNGVWNTTGVCRHQCGYAGSPECQNGGTCSSNNCICPSQYKGKFCEVRLRCNNDGTCFNNGTCALSQYIAGATEYTCQNCLPDSYGPTCNMTTQSQVVWSDLIDRMSTNYPGPPFDRHTDFCDLNITNFVCDDNKVILEVNLEDVDFTFQQYQVNSSSAWTMDFSHSSALQSLTLGSIGFDWGSLFANVTQLSNLQSLTCFPCMILGNVQFPPAHSPASEFLHLTTILLSGSWASFAMSNEAVPNIHSLQLFIDSGDTATFAMTPALHSNLYRLRVGCLPIIELMNGTNPDAGYTGGDPNHAYHAHWDCLHNVVPVDGISDSNLFYGTYWFPPGGTRPSLGALALNSVRFPDIATGFPDLFDSSRYPDLTEVGLRNAGLVGSFPNLDSMTTLAPAIIDLGVNSLTGSIPSTLASGFGSNIKVLLLDHNDLSGTTPTNLLPLMTTGNHFCLSVAGNLDILCTNGSNFTDCMTGDDLYDSCTAACTSCQSCSESSNTQCSVTGACLCSADCQGQYCEVFDNCFSSPCLHNGTCSFNLTGDSFTCDCPPEWGGTTCNVASECEPGPFCNNSGACLFDQLTGDTTCNCTGTNYTGQFCDMVDPCGPLVQTSAHMCHNGATCSANNTAPYGFVCECQYPWVGVLCDHMGTTNPCLDTIRNPVSNQAISDTDLCNVTINSYCQITGATGYVCRNTVDPSLDPIELGSTPGPWSSDDTGPCLNGGWLGLNSQQVGVDCYPPDGNTTTPVACLVCQCPLPYIGNFCEALDLSFSHGWTTSPVPQDPHPYRWQRCVANNSDFTYDGIVQGAHNFECTNCPAGGFGPSCVQQSSCAGALELLEKRLADTSSVSEGNNVYIYREYCATPNAVCDDNKQLTAWNVLDVYDLVDTIDLNGFLSYWEIPFATANCSVLTAMRIAPQLYTTHPEYQTFVGFDYAHLFAQATPATLPALKSLALLELHTTSAVNLTAFMGQLHGFQVTFAPFTGSMGFFFWEMVASYSPPEIVTVLPSNRTARHTVIAHNITNTTVEVTIMGSADFSTDLSFNTQLPDSSISYGGTGRPTDGFTPLYLAIHGAGNGVNLRITCIQDNKGSRVAKEAGTFLVDTALVPYAMTRDECKITQLGEDVFLTAQKLHFNLAQLVVGNLNSTHSDITTWIGNQNCTVLFPKLQAIQIAYSGLSFPLANISQCLADLVNQADLIYTTGFYVALQGNNISSSNTTKDLLPVINAPGQVILDLFNVSSNQLGGDFPLAYYLAAEANGGADPVYAGADFTLNPFLCSAPDGRTVNFTAFPYVMEYLSALVEACAVTYCADGYHTCTQNLNTPQFQYTCTMNGDCLCSPASALAGCVNASVCPTGFLGPRCNFQGSLDVFPLSDVQFFLIEDINLSQGGGGSPGGSVPNGYFLYTVNVTSPFFLIDPGFQQPAANQPAIITGGGLPGIAQTWVEPVDMAFLAELCQLYAVESVEDSYTQRYFPVGSTNLLDRLPDGLTEVVVNWNVSLSNLCTSGPGTTLPDTQTSGSGTAFSISAPVNSTCSFTIISVVFINPSTGAILYTQGVDGTTFTANATILASLGYGHLERVNFDALVKATCSTGRSRKRSAPPSGGQVVITGNLTVNGTTTTTTTTVTATTTAAPTTTGTPTPTTTATLAPTAAPEEEVSLGLFLGLVIPFGVLMLVCAIIAGVSMMGWKTGYSSVPTTTTTTARAGRRGSEDSIPLRSLSSSSSTAGGAELSQLF